MFLRVTLSAPFKMPVQNLNLVTTATPNDSALNCSEPSTEATSMLPVTSNQILFIKNIQKGLNLEKYFSLQGNAGKYILAWISISSFHQNSEIILLGSLVVISHELVRYKKGVLLLTVSCMIWLMQYLVDIDIKIISEYSSLLSPLLIYI